MTREKLLDLFGVPSKSFLYSFAREVADFFSSVSRMDKFETVAELRKHYEWLNDAEFKSACTRNIQLIKDGWTIYTGYASDEGSDGVERWICNESINFKTDALILETEGGY